MNHHIKSLLLITLAASLAPSLNSTARGEFQHPGITHNRASLDFVKSKIAAGDEPWATAWKAVQESRYADLDWKPEPKPHVERGPYNNPDIGSSEFSSDGNAAYRHALLWALTGKEAHAKKSAEILNAWSDTLESISNHDARLLIGMEGYDYCNAAELIKHTWDGWPQNKQAQFAKMLRGIFYPQIKDFYPSANGNWDASMLQTTLAIGVFLDDQAIFDRGVEYYLKGEGNGSIGNYFKPSGQCQESGRDQGHTQMGLDFLACSCEIAWNQGVDLYSALDNRLLKGFEYTAKYNLGFDVPYEPYRSFEGRYHYKSISDKSRGRLRPMYEKVLNHYHNRKGLEAKFTRQAAMDLRDGPNREGTDGRSNRRRRRRRSSALSTLMFANQPKDMHASTNTNPKVICFGDSITNRGYYKLLSQRLDVEAINAGVGGNSTAKALRRMSKDVLEQHPDIVVVLFGTNDLRADAEKVFVPLDKYKANLKTMIHQCNDAGAQVVLCTLPPIDHEAFFTRHERAPFQKLGGLAKLIENYRDAASEVARNHSIPLVDLNRLLAETPEWLSKDGVHPSEKGSALIAEHIAAAVSPMLAQNTAKKPSGPAPNTPNANSTLGDDWREKAQERLRAIYDRKEFRAPPSKIEWLQNSSGYQVDETDPDTNETVTAVYDVKTGERSVDADNAEEAKGDDAKADMRDRSRRLLSPDGKHALESKKQTLLISDADGDGETVLTKAADDRSVSYRNLQWSPSGKHVSFVEVDRTDVRLRSVLVPSDPSYPGVEENRFARVGEKIDSLRVGIGAKDGDVNWVSFDTPDDGFYLGQVDWVPDSDELLIEVLSRFRDKREFWLASTDGKANRIYSETNDAWAVGSHGINSGAKWIRDGEAFIYISEKGGWRQAYVCSRDGKSETKLTPGKYDIIDRAFVDEAGGWYYFYASPENGTQKHLHRVPLDGSGTLERITPTDQPGTHDYAFSPDAKWAIHTYSTLNDPPQIDLVELPQHKRVRVINDNADLRAKFKQVVPRPTEFVQIDTGEGFSMDACITKPRDFDKTKKYPVFVYVYGEPYLQTVLDRWGAAQTDFHRVIADTGYIVISIDNRGTACPKGAAWRRSVFGSLGPLSTEDQAAALKKLGEMKPYMDLSRVGIWGWSGGGSNTLNAMFRKPDVYHVGIAVVPKPQPWLYNAWFQEIYMRSREVNAEGYERSAPIHFAEGLKGKLLIMTGSGETNTHIQIIEGLIDRLVELGKPFDYMVYPNRDHGLREGKGTVVHVRMKILRYLIENLPRGPR